MLLEPKAMECLGFFHQGDTLLTDAVAQQGKQLCIWWVNVGYEHLNGGHPVLSVHDGFKPDP